MKKIISLVLIIATIVALTACKKQSPNKYVFDADTIKDYAVSEQLPSVSMTSDEYANFCSYLNYNNIDCPYSNLFGLNDAFAEKSNRTFDVAKHTYTFFDGSSTVDSEKLFNVVKKNNKAYMEGSGRFFNKELSDSKLKECCTIVADTLNWGIENIEGIDLAELGCILGNLKILNNNSMNLGTFDYKKSLLNTSQDMIKSKESLSGADIYELTVTHETMHILQCPCTDINQDEDDAFIGTSYSFANLAINPLKITWLYEASAELNTVLRYNYSPTTYRYMIDNLESISLATVLNDNVKARQLEKLCFTRDVETLYKQLEFTDKTKAAEFLYAVELLRNKPDDFKTAYETAYGTVQEDYSDFIKKTYYPYFAEVVSKLLYKNLALKLTQNEISLNDVFYIISMYELDLLKDIPLDHPDVKGRYIDIYDQYTDLQNKFFEIIQNHTDVNVYDSFAVYQMNYGDASVYANASLDWLDNQKRDYILYRNNVMYDKTYKHINTFNEE